MKPTIGRIVHYKLSEKDAEQINRRRTTSDSIAVRINEDNPLRERWPRGAQAHIGTYAREGDVLPMIVVCVWPEGCIDGQVFLDGNDTLWIRLVGEGSEYGRWSWPPRETV